MTVVYTLPYHISKKAYIEKARIYFSANNLCLLYRGNKYPIDPEINASERSLVNPNNDGYSMGVWGRVAPMPRTVYFVVHVTLYTYKLRKYEK